jgi:hypothetical protein
MVQQSFAADTFKRRQKACCYELKIGKFSKAARALTKNEATGKNNPTN